MFSLELSCKNELNLLIVDFFRKKHINNIVWQDELSCLDIQKEFISKTVDSRLVLRYKIDVRYQRKFLKKLMGYLDEIGAEVGGEIYEAFCRLSTGVEEKLYFVFYPIFEINKLSSLRELRTIILKENVNMISQGTTGLITWQASQALAEWVLGSSSDKRSILELGSGTGLTGLVVTTSTSCKRYIFTDGHSDVLSLLKHNVALNCDEVVDMVKPNTLFTGSVGNCDIEIRKLDWETCRDDECKEIGSVDLIVAADVIYDKDLFTPLINAIKLFLSNGTKAAVVAFTERDENTVKSFHAALESVNLNIKWLHTPEPNYLSWEMLQKIHIIEITI